MLPTGFTIMCGLPQTTGSIPDFTQFAFAAAPIMAQWFAQGAHCCAIATHNDKQSNTRTHRTIRALVESMPHLLVESILESKPCQAAPNASRCAWSGWTDEMFTPDVRAQFNPLVYGLAARKQPLAGCPVESPSNNSIDKEVDNYRKNIWNLALPG
jgi:hypothetical protein